VYYIDHMIQKLGGACCAIRMVFHISSIDAIIVLPVYCACHHSVMKYGLSLVGNLS
jgi:hypothetical protein